MIQLLLACEKPWSRAVKGGAGLCHECHPHVATPAGDSLPCPCPPAGGNTSCPPQLVPFAEWLQRSHMPSSLGASWTRTPTHLSASSAGAVATGAQPAASVRSACELLSTSPRTLPAASPHTGRHVVTQPSFGLNSLHSSTDTSRCESGPSWLLLCRSSEGASHPDSLGCVQFNKLMGDTRATLKARLNYSPEIDHDTMWKSERQCAPAGRTSSLR